MYAWRRSKFGLRLILLLAIALAGSAATAPTSQPTTARIRKPSFMTVLLRNWDRWDLNHDGVLSEDEITRAALDPKVTGDDAAAAAALKAIVRQGKYPLPPLTRDYFRQWAIHAAHQATTRAAHGAETQPAPPPTAEIPPVKVGSSKQPNWELAYRAAVRRIDRGGAGRLWPESGLSLEHMRQGPLGDCYLVSAIGAEVARDPKSVQQLIVPLENGRYRVSFPATRPVEVGPLTDAEVAISSSTEGDGVWLAVLEQAYGRRRAKVIAEGDAVEFTDVIAHGGFMGTALMALTDHSIRSVSIPATVEERHRRRPRILLALRTELTSAQNDHRLMGVGVSGVPTTIPTDSTLPAIPPGISTRHAYAILSYDPETDMLEFWNPHGQTFHPAGSPGLAHGYPTEHGRFKVPLREAFEFCGRFVFESPKTLEEIAAQQKQKTATIPGTAPKG